MGGRDNMVGGGQMTSSGTGGMMGGSVPMHGGGQMGGQMRGQGQMNTGGQMDMQGQMMPLGLQQPSMYSNAPQGHDRHPNNQRNPKHGGRGVDNARHQPRGGGGVGPMYRGHDGPDHR